MNKEIVVKAFNELTRILDQPCQSGSQKDQHYKETKTLEYLSKLLGSRFKKSTDTEDKDKGIDCYIDGSPYDLKATFDSKFTYDKFLCKKDCPNKCKCNGARRDCEDVNRYNPLTLHTNVKYLLPIRNQPFKFRLYEKKDIDSAPNYKVRTGMYNGDKNINYYYDISEVEGTTLSDKPLKYRIFDLSPVVVGEPIKEELKKFFERPISKEAFLGKTEPTMAELMMMEVADYWNNPNDLRTKMEEQQRFANWEW